MLLFRIALGNYFQRLAACEKGTKIFIIQGFANMFVEATRRPCTDDLNGGRNSSAF